jgi:RNA polymerase sigma-70 factor (ECF subfamily)
VPDELEKRDDQFRLEQALAQLPGNYRRALTAHFIEGLSIRKIAHREQVPIGTVLSRIHTGKQLLRDAWEAAVPTARENGSADLTWDR